MILKTKLNIRDENITTSIPIYKIQSPNSLRLRKIVNLIDNNKFIYFSKNTIVINVYLFSQKNDLETDKFNRYIFQSSR